MSRTLHVESLGGASGDMLLGVFIGLGVSLEELNRELRTLQVDPFEIVADKVVIEGMSGIQARVELEECSTAHSHSHDHDHDHHHDHGRHLSTILSLIDKSDLPAPVKAEASAVFQRIGEAEAAIHGIDIEQIHFHEVGAMDSIIDIVGCTLAKHKLGIDQLTCRSLPQGYGTIECAHGTYPNPAPATLRILEGFPIETVDEPHELVTPTGAALISVWHTGSAPPTGACALHSVYSFGQRTLDHRPNLLRATLYETQMDATPTHCEMIECNLDDTTPELLGLLSASLLEAGALDVTMSALIMKKSRPGTLLQVLTTSADRERLISLIFAESSTFGVRTYSVEREILTREKKIVSTRYGDVSVKIGAREGIVVQRSPEIESCRACAESAGVAVREVYQAALVAAREELNDVS